MQSFASYTLSRGAQLEAMIAPNSRQPALLPAIRNNTEKVGVITGAYKSGTSIGRLAIDVLTSPVSAAFISPEKKKLDHGASTVNVDSMSSVHQRVLTIAGGSNWEMETSLLKDDLKLKDSKATQTLPSSCKLVPQASPMITLQYPPSGPLFSRDKIDKIVVVLGAIGKSRLAIDLALIFHAEIINSDKMQVYKGLDTLTNKVPVEQRKGVPHHLLGTIDPDVNFTANDFKYHAYVAIESILQRKKVPIIAGGPNSFIEALVDEHHGFRRRYECCFLWVDVTPFELNSLVAARVEQMVEHGGLVDEVRSIFDHAIFDHEDYSVGIRKAIGVPELHDYLRGEVYGNDEETQEALLKEASLNIKKNTCQLAHRQLQKIHRLRRKWCLHRLDATEAFVHSRGGREGERVWEEHVSRPAATIVSNFLLNLTQG